MMVATLSLVEVTRKVRELRAELVNAPAVQPAAVRSATLDELAAEAAGREYREAAAKARDETTARELSRKPFELKPVADVA
jgi:hypothetical protein